MSKCNIENCVDIAFVSKIVKESDFTYNINFCENHIHRALEVDQQKIPLYFTIHYTFIISNDWGGNAIITTADCDILDKLGSECWNDDNPSVYKLPDIYIHKRRLHLFTTDYVNVNCTDCLKGE